LRRCLYPTGGRHSRLLWSRSGGEVFIVDEFAHRIEADRDRRGPWVPRLDDDWVNLTAWASSSRMSLWTPDR